MNVIVRWFRTQKAGNAFEECEDKSYPKYLNEKHGVYGFSSQNFLAFGVADGATEGMFSGVWAEILVKAFCRSKNNNVDVEYVVDKASKDWNSWMRNYIAERVRHSKPIQWYEEPGLKAGGFSTLLGFVLTYSEESRSSVWRALAVGDTCLFCVRDGKLVLSFPIENSSDFSNRPSLISSNLARNKESSESKRIFQSEWYAHDLFYIMTDALACWFLQEYEAGNSPWLSFPFVCNGSEEVTFESWVESLRSAKKMKNDDVTLIHIEVVG
jgi:hypothetical protein